MADKALLLGVNDYQSISDLRGCINDVNNMKQLLTESYAFDNSNIKTLMDKDVVLDNIVDGFTWLFEGAENDDRLVFHFSGHGSYIPSESDDEPVDELICLWDMDWDNLDSYLIDDDLGDYTKNLPTGARLTIVLDSCHSGTGTKAISGSPTYKEVKTITSKSRLVLIDDSLSTVPEGQQKAAKARFAKSGSSFLPDEDFQPVFARFVYPPKSKRVDIASSRFRRIGKSAQDKPLNHQLLAAARDNQTAADAFIDEQYQGAFTYYLCHTARELGDSVSAKTIMDQTQTKIQGEGYSQVPQLEGIGFEERLFGGPATGEGSEDFDLPPIGVQDPLPDGASRPPQQTPDRMRIFSQMLTVQEKLLDLGNKLFDDSLRLAELTGLPARKARATGDEIVVYVHGISRHPKGYSNAWFNAMNPHLVRTIPKEEVYWSDIVNPRSIGGKSLPALSKSGIELRQAIERELEQRQKQLDKQIPPGTRNLRPLEKGPGFSWDDFIRYMTNESTRNSILQRFDQVVRPLLESGKSIHIVSHSWGTVIAYEGLRKLDSSSLPGRVENLFVAGSALSVSVVQWNLFQRVLDGRRPRHVRNIINLDAGGDIVGGSLAGEFTVSSQHLNLKPTGCSTIPFTNIAWSVSCAHSSYFDRGNNAVNRDIFAKWING